MKIQLVFLCLSALCEFARADYVTYIGDSFPYQASAIAVDAAGNTYVAGGRELVVPVNGTSPITDVFLTKLDPRGNIVFTVTLGGEGSAQANGVAVDTAGNIFVAGSTTSPDFPLLNPLQNLIGSDSEGNPQQTGFLAKFTPDGSRLFSTFLGGEQGGSSLGAVAVDKNGNAYVTGWTNAPDSQHTPGLPPGGGTGPKPGGISSAFFAKISATGDQIVYAGGFTAPQILCGPGSACVLSSSSTAGVSIAVDSAGNAYIAGNTNGGGLVGTPGALLASGIGAFIGRINAAGSAVTYFTYLGSGNTPGNPDKPWNTLGGIAVDAVGNAYLVGSTADPNFPATKGSYQPGSVSQISPGLSYQVFVAKLNPFGSAIVWATYLGGAPGTGQSLAVDSAGDVWVSGIAPSANSYLCVVESACFPNADGFPQGSQFLVEFNPSGAALLYSALFPSGTVGPAIAVDASGVVHSAGGTGMVSTITPSQSSAPRLLGLSNAAGGAIAGRVSPGELISIYGLNLVPKAPLTASFNSAGFLPTSFGGVQVTIGGTPLPLLYVSSTQINAVAPVELVNPGAGQLQVSLSGSALPDLRIVADAADPGVFKAMVLVNPNGIVTNSASPGTIVEIWATGLPPLSGAVDGQEQTTSTKFFCVCSVSALLSSGGTPHVLYAGAAPGTVTGMFQINFQIPSNYPVSDDLAFFVVSADGKNSAPFSICISSSCP